MIVKPPRLEILASHRMLLPAGRLSQSLIYDSPGATIYSCTCYNSLSPSPVLAVLLIYIRQSKLNSLCSRLRFRVRCYTVSDLVSVCNPFFNTFLIKNIIFLYPRLSSVTTGSRGWLGSFLLFWEVQFFCSAISLLTKARLGSSLRMLFWEMQFFCWPSFFWLRE